MVVASKGEFAVDASYASITNGESQREGATTKSQFLMFFTVPTFHSFYGSYN